MAAASSATRDSLGLVLVIVSSDSGEARIRCTAPVLSKRQSMSKNIPLYRSGSNSAISRSSASRPGAVCPWHVGMLAVLSMMLYFRLAASWSGPRNVHPRRSPRSATLFALPIIKSLKRWQSLRSTSVLIALVMCWHSATYGVCT